jgi:aldose 1-epimerase
MRFSISHREENKLDLVVLKDEQSGTEAAILPGCGALLHGFSLLVNAKYFNVIDNYNSHDELQQQLASSFKSSKLSPFACRIPDGKYAFAGSEYELQTKFRDGSAIHGLLYNKSFAITAESAGDDNASINMQYEYQKDDAGYPFYYRCEVRYSLSAENSLRVQTTVSNTSDETIPIADGWHPYFKLGGKIDDWFMHFQADAILEFDAKLIPTGNVLPYPRFNKPELIGELELDNCFLLKKNQPGPACELYNPGNKVTLSFLPGAGYPYLQIYTPPQRNSIAIENLSAAPDCFNNKMGLVLLPAGDSQTFTVYYQLALG